MGLIMKAMWAMTLMKKQGMENAAECEAILRGLPNDLRVSLQPLSDFDVQRSGEMTNARILRGAHLFRGPHEFPLFVTSALDSVVE